MDIWGKKSIFCIVIAIFVDGAYHQYTRGYNFPIGTTPNKISVSELGVIFWGSPLFLALLGLCRIIGISTLNFGPFSTKLGGTVWARVVESEPFSDFPFRARGHFSGLTPVFGRFGPFPNH